MKITSISLALIAASIMAPIPACVQSAVAQGKGFSPSYVGVGGTYAASENGDAAEIAIIGAYRAEGIDAPVTFRGSLYPSNGVEGVGAISYDYGVAKNTNLYGKGGFFAGGDEVYPTVGLGTEYLFEDQNVVLYGDYSGVFADSYTHFTSFGVGYQF